MNDYIVTFNKEPVINEHQREKIEGAWEASIEENYDGDPKKWLVSTPAELTEKSVEKTFSEAGITGIKVDSIKTGPF